MNYKFGEITLKIECAKEYENFFERHLTCSSFTSKPEITIKCFDDATINIFNKTKKIPSITKSDLYYILFNALSNIINNNSEILVHSAVIQKNSKAVLLLGDFGSGKTTLAELSQNYGYKIISTDQTWLKIENNQLKLKYGTHFEFMRNGKIRHLEINNLNTTISQIILTKAVIKGAKYFETIYYNSEQIKKRIYHSFGWSASTPIGKHGIFLPINTQSINIFVDKLISLNIPFKEVWGYKNIIKHLIH